MMTKSFTHTRRPLSFTEKRDASTAVARSSAEFYAHRYAHVKNGSRGKPLGAVLLSREAPPGFEPGIEDLQSSALPLGYGANWKGGARPVTRRSPPSCHSVTSRAGERETGLEPATPTLARWCSTN